MPNQLETQQMKPRDVILKWKAVYESLDGTEKSAWLKDLEEKTKVEMMVSVDGTPHYVLTPDAN